MAKYNIIQLYQQVFGYRGLPQIYPPDVINRVPEPVDYNDFELRDERTDTELMSSMGVPLFMPTKLNDFWLPNEPLITINGQNVVERTKLTGIKGTVKERISTDDISIKIQGIIINEETDDYPEDQVRALRQIIESQDAVQISNRMLTLFDVHQVAIIAWNFAGIEGHQDCQTYEITCVSDWPVDLILKENNA